MRDSGTSAGCVSGAGGGSAGEVAARLERNLRGQLSAQERLLEVIRSQREAMRRLDAAGLRRALDAATGISAEIEALVDERRRLLSALFTGCDSTLPPVEVGSTAWNALLERVPRERAHRLRTLRGELHRSAERLLRANAVNRQVVEGARRHFTGLLEALVGSGGSAVYAPRAGRVTVAAVTPNTLINRVA